MNDRKTDNATSYEQDKQAAGPIGNGFSGVLADKVTAAIDGFPDSTSEQREAIVRLVIHRLRFPNPD